MKGIIQGIILIMLLGIMTSGVLYVWSWKEFKSKEIKNEAIQGCFDAANRANSTGGFHGAVFKICMEDKGYDSSIR